MSGTTSSSEDGEHPHDTLARHESSVIVALEALDDVPAWTREDGDRWWRERAQAASAGAEVVGTA